MSPSAKYISYEGNVFEVAPVIKPGLKLAYKTRIELWHQAKVLCISRYSQKYVYYKC